MPCPAVRTRTGAPCSVAGRAGPPCRGLAERGRAVTEGRTRPLGCGRGRRWGRHGALGPAPLRSSRPAGGGEGGPAPRPRCGGLLSPVGRRCRAAPGRALRCGVRAVGARWAPWGRGARTARGLWASPGAAAPLPGPRGWPVPSEPGQRSLRAGGSRRPLLGCSGRWGCGVSSVQPPLLRAAEIPVPFISETC